MLEVFLENVNVALNRSSAKDMDVDNKVVSRGEAWVYDVIYTELKLMYVGLRIWNAAEGYTVCIIGCMDYES